MLVLVRYNNYTKRWYARLMAYTRETPHVKPCELPRWVADHGATSWEAVANVVQRAVVRRKLHPDWWYDW